MTLAGVDYYSIDVAPPCPLRRRPAACRVEGALRYRVVSRIRRRKFRLRLRPDRRQSMPVEEAPDNDDESPYYRAIDFASSARRQKSRSAKDGAASAERRDSCEVDHRLGAGEGATHEDRRLQHRFSISRRILLYRSRSAHTSRPPRPARGEHGRSYHCFRRRLRHVGQSPGRRLLATRARERWLTGVVGKGLHGFDDSESARLQSHSRR